MRTFVGKLTLVLIAVSVLTGIFIAQLLAVSEIHIPNIEQLRWAQIIGMPILLFVSYHYLALQPANNRTSVILQTIGQLAVFMIPYLWVLNHAQ